MILETYLQDLTTEGSMLSENDQRLLQAIIETERLNEDEKILVENFMDTILQKIGENPTAGKIGEYFMKIGGGESAKSIYIPTDSMKQLEKAKIYYQQAVDAGAPKETLEKLLGNITRKQRVLQYMKARVSNINDMGARERGAGFLGAVGGVVLATALLYGGYQTYKRFFSKAAKACAGKSFSEKTQCMENFKKQAIQAQIKDLQAGSKACAKSKDPGVCKSKIQKKISKLQSKLK